jgi:hypothetical protein
VHHGANIPRRTVAAGEENQRNAGILQLFDRLAGIRRAAAPIMQLTEHPVTEAHLGQQIGAHRSGKGQKLQVVLQCAQALQRRARTYRRQRLAAQGQGLLGHTITALEARRTAKTCQGIDDQAQVELRHKHLVAPPPVAQGSFNP